MKIGPMTTLVSPQILSYRVFRSKMKTKGKEVSAWKNGLRNSMQPVYRK